MTTPEVLLECDLIQDAKEVRIVLDLQDEDEASRMFARLKRQFLDGLATIDMSMMRLVDASREGEERR